MPYYACEVNGAGGEFRPALAALAAQAGLGWSVAVDGRVNPGLAAGVMLVRCADHASLSGVSGIRPLRKAMLAQFGATDDGEADDWEAPDLARKAVRRLLLRQWLRADDFPLALTTKLADTGVPLLRLRNRLLALQPRKPLDLAGITAQSMVGDALGLIFPQIDVRLEGGRQSPSGTFTDNFENAGGSNVNLEDWSPSGGTAWTRVDGSVGGAAVSSFSDRLLTDDNSSEGTAYRCDDQGSADHYVQYSVENTNLSAFVANRLTDRDDFIGVRVTGSTVQVWKRVAGTLTQLGAGATDVSVDQIVRLESSGNAHEAFLDGSSEISGINDAHNNAETRQGVVSRLGINGVWIDDFEAGVLASGGGPVTGTGTLVASAAAIAGEGFSGSFGQATLAAQLAAITGEGFSGSFGTGELQADMVSVEGYDVVPPVVDGFIPIYRPRRR